MAGWGAAEPPARLEESHWPVAWQNAFLAATIVAIVAGAVGYFMVLRGQSFAGHAMGHAGFSGATGALVLDVAPVLGLLIVGVATAIVMGALDAKTRASGAANGTVYTFCLGLGVLFLQLYSGQAENAYALLFGAVLGISDQDIRTIVVTAAITLGVLLVIGRPLLFASIDPDAAASQGIPVGALSITFLVLLAFAVTQAVQVVGIVLIFALLVTPAATARYLTARPGLSLLLSVILAVAFSWVGLAIAYFAPYPVTGFYITSVAFSTYISARLLYVLRR